MVYFVKKYLDLSMIGNVYVKTINDHRKEQVEEKKLVYVQDVG